MPNHSLLIDAPEENDSTDTLKISVKPFQIHISVYMSAVKAILSIFQVTALRTLTTHKGCISATRGSLPGTRTRITATFTVPGGLGVPGGLTIVTTVT